VLNRAFVKFAPRGDINLLAAGYLKRTHPVSTTYRAAFTRDIVCALICKLMGKRHDRYGSFRPGATAALDVG
jgi:hypothetical protein